jgi:hypothetical protein
MPFFFASLYDTIKSKAEFVIAKNHRKKAMKPLNTARSDIAV